MQPAQDDCGGTTGPALHAAKRSLRDQVLARRNALPPAERATASALIAGRVEALPSFVRARTVLLTLPFGSEWDTRNLVLAALAAAKTVALPRVDPVSRMLGLHAVADLGSDVVAGWQGIPEPRASAPAVPPAAVDWVLMPGVAFDATGRRLGYGGGFYDRLLPLLAAATPRIAACFEVQLVAAVPAGRHDLPVDCIVTEARTLPIAP